MTDQRATLILRANAVVYLAVGVLFVLDTWDNLYSTLDLPQALPALLTQLGGAVLVAFAYLLWRAAPGGELRRVVATAAAMANVAAALILLAWLVFRGKADLRVDTQGIVELIVAAVVLGAFGVAQTLIAREPAR
jgi:drug/metabolite transporter (DMT)-like permease